MGEKILKGQHRGQKGWEGWTELIRFGQAGPQGATGGHRKQGQRGHGMKGHLMERGTEVMRRGAQTGEDPCDRQETSSIKAGVLVWMRSRGRELVWSLVS